LLPVSGDGLPVVRHQEAVDAQNIGWMRRDRLQTSRNNLGGIGIKLSRIEIDQRPSSLPLGRFRV
jgi:hypothetical protein